MERERKEIGERKGIAGGKRRFICRVIGKDPLENKTSDYNERGLSHSRVKGREGAIDQFKDTFQTCPELQGSYRDLTPGAPAMTPQ